MASMSDRRAALRTSRSRGNAQRRRSLTRLHRSRDAMATMDVRWPVACRDNFFQAMAAVLRLPRIFLDMVAHRKELTAGELHHILPSRISVRCTHAPAMRHGSQRWIIISAPQDGMRGPTYEDSAVFCAAVMMRLRPQPQRRHRTSPARGRATWLARRRCWRLPSLVSTSSRTATN